MAEMRKRMGMIEEQWYVLDEHKLPFKVDRQTGWMAYNDNRSVKVDELCGCKVSTVFLGLDHNHVGKPGDDPILFETMIYGNKKYSKFQQRCSTWNQAITMHESACALIRRDAINDNQIESKVADPHSLYKSEISNHNVSVL